MHHVSISYQGSGPLTIGRRLSRVWPFQGFINNLRIWNRALSIEEIGEDMYKPAKEVEEAVGNWAFDEGSGDTIHDQASENDGQLHLGHVLEFDGLDDCVKVDHQIKLANTSFTVEFWAKVNARSWSPWLNSSLMRVSACSARACSIEHLLL